MSPAPQRGGQWGKHSGRLCLPALSSPPPERGRSPTRRNASLLAAIGAAVAAAAAFVIALSAVPEKAHAVCSVLSHHPCTPYFGSVLRRHPFTPYSCGVTGGPCSPEVVLPFRQVPVIRVEGHAGPPEAVDRDHQLDRLNEIALLLSKCLELPPDSESQAGMELALKLAFKRDGELLADPRFTYTREASQKVKEAYHTAALDMLKRCTPLPVTDGLGGAIAGRPFVVAIKDGRDLSGSATPSQPGGGNAPARDAPGGNASPGESKP